jgi:hypothetical protein
VEKEESENENAKRIKKSKQVAYSGTTKVR